MSINIWTDSMQHAALLGKPVLFTNWLIQRDTPASVRICRCIKRLIRISRSPALSSVFQSGPQTAL